jgi:hypothetical protein
MKQAQWAGAVVVLAAMVFAITFAMNYLGGSGGGDKGISVEEKKVNQLRFDVPVAPIGLPLECEANNKRTYHHDFWFKNENAEDARIGLARVSCERCIRSVQLHILPGKAVERLTAFYAGMVGRLSGAGMVARLSGPMLPLAAWAADLPVEVAARRAAQEGVEGHELMHKEAPVTVPAGAIGWVRLNWIGESVGPQALTAVLWADERGGPKTDVQVRVMFQKALRVRAPQLYLATLRDENLGGKGHTVEIVCWSSTRPRFGLKAEAPGREHGADPFTVGKPVRLKPAELAALEAHNNRPKADVSERGRVLSGYRVPITLKRMAADGKTPVPLGPFRRGVILKMSDDEDVEHVRIDVSGRVVGLVEVEGDEGTLSFDAPFKRSDGAKAKTTLRSSAVAELRLDRERTKKAAPFLRVDEKLLATPETDGDGQTWTLRVTIPPNEARGQFPRSEDPDYEDSAIYLKARPKGKKQPERTIRIPVVGVALEG